MEPYSAVVDVDKRFKMNNTDQMYLLFGQRRKSETKIFDFNVIAKIGLTLLCDTPSRYGTFLPVRQLGIRETRHLHKLGFICAHSIAPTESQQA